MLSKELITQYLETLHEHKMAADIFVPVLKAMNIQGVKFTGGTGEQGIDIEYYELTEPEKNKSYVGIQFKKGSLTYSARGTKNTVKEVRNQAEEAFEKEIHDLEGRGTYYISRFVVGVTGEINEGARAYIGKARQKGADRRIDYWDGDRLAEYIQIYWMNEFIEYFNIDPMTEPEPEDDYQIINGEYLWENYEKMIKLCLKVRLTISGFEWDMLLAIAKLQVMENMGTGVPMADFLMEIGRTEDYMDRELRNLVGQLEYIDVDDKKLSLSGHATSLTELLDIIIGELVEAEEETVRALDLFQEILT